MAQVPGLSAAGLRCQLTRTPSRQSRAVHEETASTAETMSAEEPFKYQNRREISQSPSERHPTPNNNVLYSFLEISWKGVSHQRGAQGVSVPGSQGGRGVNFSEEWGRDQTPPPHEGLSGQCVAD